MAHDIRHRRRVLEDRIHDGFSYIFEKTKRGVIYLVCKETRRNHCTGRAKLDLAGQFQPTQAHNHPADPSAEPVQIFKRFLRQHARNQIEDLKDVYDNLRVLHHEAAIRVTYASIESSMRRWRRQVQPPIPRTLQEYGELLQNEEWRSLYLNYNRGAIQAACVYDADGSVSVVFGNPEFAHLLADSTEIFADATYKVVPRLGYQLLTLMAVKNNHAFPFVWALMERKTQMLYEAVLEHAKNVIAPEMRPILAMADFETGLQNAIAAAYPDATIHGCLFHYCQALQRKLKALGIAQQLNVNLELRLAVRKMMALALLPVAMIVPCFETICETQVEAVEEVLRPFFAYYRNQWINRVTPASFSVFRLLRRTNNCVESYHRVLFHKMSMHPAIWKFTKELACIQSNVHADLRSVQQGLSVSKAPKMKYFLNNQRLNAKWRDLEAGLLLPQEFLENASHMMENVIGVVQLRVDGQVGNGDGEEGNINGPDRFIIAQEHNPVNNIEIIPDDGVHERPLLLEL